MAGTPHATIPFMSPEWMLGLGLTVLVMAVAIALGLRLDGAARWRWSRALGWISLAQWGALWTYGIAYGFWSYKESLPFHLCGIAGALAILLMFRPRQWTYELTWYWGIPGAANALLTPVLNWGDSPYLRADFYVGHGIIVLIALWATIVLEMRPRPGSWWRVFLVTQLFLPVIGGINWLLDANYMFLCDPPDIDSPLIVGEFPYHLIGYEVAALGFFLLLYVPFARSSPASTGPGADSSPRASSTSPS